MSNTESTHLPDLNDYVKEVANESRALFQVALIFYYSKLSFGIFNHCVTIIDCPHVGQANLLNIYRIEIGRLDE
jgi:hypothetical protein